MKHLCHYYSYYLEDFLTMYHRLDGDVSNYERIYCEKGDIKSMIRLLLKGTGMTQVFISNELILIRNVADLYILLGETEAAVQLYAQVLHMYRENNRGSLVPRVLKDLIKIYKKTGQHEKSIETREERICICAKYGYGKSGIKGLGSLTKLYLKTGQMRKAIMVSLKTLSYFLIDPFKFKLNLKILKLAGSYYCELGETCKAEPLYALQRRIRDYNWPSDSSRSVRKMSIRGLRRLYSSEI